MKDQKLIVAVLPNPLRKPNVKTAPLVGNVPAIPTSDIIFNIRYNENGEGIVTQVKGAENEVGPFRVKNLIKTNDTLSFELFEPVQKNVVITYTFKKGDNDEWKGEDNSYVMFI